MIRPRFDTRSWGDRRYVAGRDFTYAGKDFTAGQPFDIAGLALHNVRTLYGSRYIGFAPDAAPAAEAEQLVKVANVGGGNYDITAPWLAKPLRVRGKAKAEAEYNRLVAEGPPLGFIEGGSQITVEALDGGWFAVSAPWLDEPEKVQGREAAERRQRELHAAGEPSTYGGVTLAEGENGWWTITRPEFDGELKVQGEEAARTAAAQLRAGELIDGQPVEWTPSEPLKVGDVVLVAHEDSALNGQTATLDAIDGEEARVVAFKDSAEEGKDQELVEDTVPLASLTLAEAATPPIEVTPGEGEHEGKFIVSGGALAEPEVFDTDEAANERADELRGTDAESDEAETA